MSVAVFGYSTPRHDSNFMIYMALKGSIPKPAQSSIRPPWPGVLGPSGAGETFTMQ